MADITPKTTALTDMDDVRALLMKILHRLNLNAGAQVDVPSGNVAVTNTPLPIDFDGTQPVAIQGQPHVLVDNASLEVNIHNTLLDPAFVEFAGNQPVTIQNQPDVNVINVPDVHIRNGSGNELAHVSADGHLSIASSPVELEAAHDNSYGTKQAYAFHITGRRSGFNSNILLQDINQSCSGVQNVDAHTPPSTIDDLEIYSTSDQDHAAGLGAQTVRICYLNAAGSMQETIVNLDGEGTVAVPIDATFIQWMEVATAGSTGYAMGDIRLSNVNTGYIYDTIAEGCNKSEPGHFKVPTGFHAFVPRWTVSSRGGSGFTIDARLAGQAASFTRASQTPFLHQDAVTIETGQPSAINELPWLKLPAGTIIKVNGRVSNTANHIVIVSFSVLIFAT